MPYVIDAAIVLLLAFFAWRGAARGLIMSLCGLTAVFVAFFAALLVSDAFCVPVAGIIRPVITESVQDAVRGVENLNDSTLDDLLVYLRENELFPGISDFTRQAAPTGVQAQESPVNALADYLSKGIAKTVLFGSVFLVVQLIWFLLSHTLDLAFKLPILAEVNLAGGLAVGLMKGVLFTIVLVWLGQASGVVPNRPETPILSLFTVDKLGELLAALPA